MPARSSSAPLLSALVLASGMPALAASQASDYFERNVRPVLVANCYACHGPSAPEPQADLRLDSRAAILKGGRNGPAVIPGRPGESRLLQVLTGKSGVRMPPAGSLTQEQIDHIAEWVRMGAPYPEAPDSGPDLGHWSLQPPAAEAAPRSESGWAVSEIDRFVEWQLRERSLSPSAPAGPRTLIRRLYLDLVGFPPTPEEVDQFAAEPGEPAYEALVDSLLSSERFGERWARYWLDVARYADDGSQARPFPIAWTYRDWVIEALNDDMPYDEFVLRQLAADLLGGDRRHLAALGFLAVGLNGPRPTDVPENVDDRIDVITRGLLGLSVSCARCHDHKFDPIPQADYYSLYGVMLNSPVSVDPVPIDDHKGGPSSDFFNEKLAKRRASLDTYKQERLSDHVREFREPEMLGRYLEAGWHSRHMSNPEVERLSKERDLNHYLLDRWRNYLSGLRGQSLETFRELDGAGGAARLAQRMSAADRARRWPDPEREALRLALRGNGSPTDIPLEDFWWVQNEGDSNVMKALRWQYHTVVFDWSLRGGPRHASVVREPSRLLPAHIFVRGNQHDKGRRVPRRFLSALPGPREFKSGAGRLEFARAIASSENPLTARVMVNRVWARLFGEGIVRTTSDFGLRGDRPSHPRLLDHLASEFVDQGWSVKGLVRQIVLTKAYRQSSQSREDGNREDPDNLLLWRQNRTRLDFEALRDSMLRVSGRLNQSTGGPPFELRAVPSSPRRTVYAYVSRERPSALMRTFDFSNPEEHAPKRQVTTVPQQALFLMNGSFVAEQARAAVANCQEGAECPEQVHRRILGRSPSHDEMLAARNFLTAAAASPAQVRNRPQSRWAHGISSIDPATGATGRLAEFRYRVDDRLQASPMPASRRAGRASLTPDGGHPGDGLDSAVVRRWTAPRSMRIAVKGTLSHLLGSLGRRFDYSNGVRGWLVSSRQGLLGSWVVRGSKAETAFQDLRVEEGEWLDFVVGSRGDYESDSFQWSPVIESLDGPAVPESNAGPQAWSAREGFPQPSEPPLGPLEQYAQTLLMTNEFAFRD